MAAQIIRHEELVTFADRENYFASDVEARAYLETFKRETLERLKKKAPEHFARAAAAFADGWDVEAVEERAAAPTETPPPAAAVAEEIHEPIEAPEELDENETPWTTPRGTERG